MTSSTNDEAPPTGPILFAYDGTDIAAFAIEQAAHLLIPGRDAFVLCVWQPADVGFTPVTERHFDADRALDVKNAAEETAEHGAVLATRAGFHATSIVVEAAPTWQGIVATAEERHASLIVLGSHRRVGLIGHLLGSVASSVVAHARCSVLVAHDRD